MHWLGIILLYTVTDQNIAFLVPVEQQKGTVTVKAMTTHMTPLKTLRMTFVSAIFNWNMVESNSFITDSKFKWASGQKKNNRYATSPQLKCPFILVLTIWFMFRFIYSEMSKCKDKIEQYSTIFVDIFIRFMLSGRKNRTNVYLIFQKNSI